MSIKELTELLIPEKKMSPHHKVLRRHGWKKTTTDAYGNTYYHHTHRLGHRIVVNHESGKWRHHDSRSAKTNRGHGTTHHGLDKHLSKGH